MCTLFVARVSTFDPKEPLLLALSVADHTKKRWNDSLDFLCAGDLDRTRPLSVFAFRGLLSWQFQGFWTARRSRGQGVCVWHGQPIWTARLKTVFCCTLVFSKHDKHRKDSVSFHRYLILRNMEFRWRLSGGCSFDCSRCPKTAKIWRKNSNNGEWTIHRRGKEAQVVKNKTFPLTCCWARRLEGTW